MIGMVRPETRRLLGIVTAAAMVAASSPADADAIDGNWCSPNGRTLSIHGPEIVTPGGNRIDGRYDRHYFSYVIPGSEPGAGRTVNMTLLGENTVRIEADAASGTPTEIWNRCGPSVSELEHRIVAG
jgi:hypothetical protein